MEDSKKASDELKSIIIKQRCRLEKNSRLYKEMNTVLRNNGYRQS